MTFPSPLRLSSELLVTLGEPERNKDRVSLQHVRLAMLVGWEGDALRYCRARPHRQVAAGRPFPRLPSTGYLADDIVVEVRGVIMSKMV